MLCLDEYDFSSKQRGLKNEPIFLSSGYQFLSKLNVVRFFVKLYKLFRDIIFLKKVNHVLLDMNLFT